MKNKIIKNCAYCNKEFEGNNYVKYCSLYCRNEASIEYTREYQKKHYTEIRKYKKICTICRKEFYTDSDKKECCSSECIKINNKNKYLESRKIKICPICNKEFQSNKKCCSEECSRIDIKNNTEKYLKENKERIRKGNKKRYEEKYRDKQLKKYKENATKNCVVCNKEFNSLDTGFYKFCSEECCKIHNNNKKRENQKKGSKLDWEKK